MAKKQMLFKTKGMNQDLSVSAFNPEFSFENRNLRISTNEGNTQLSWVNEKGTAPLEIYKENANGTPSSDTIEIEGTVIGTAILNSYLILFVKGESTDIIYRLRYIDNTKKVLQGKKLYDANGLGLDVNHPIETLVSYESELVQKVYWVDGINQPRVINICKDYTATRSEDYNPFDFIQTLKLREEVYVQKQFGGGMFASGVIQYAFTYYNKYGPETNIFYTTPLLYISYRDRGASPEDKVENSFKITVTNIDKNFEYLRIYSIQRTSINGTPICKRVQDIEILPDMGSATYIDTGTSGDSIDPTELLFKGGEPIIAETLEQKDSTLFLGSLTNIRKRITNDLIIKNEIVPLKRYIELLDVEPDKRVSQTTNISGSPYIYNNQLSLKEERNGKVTTVPCGGFKTGNFYRLGLQFQHNSGKWSDPIYINSKMDVFQDAYVPWENEHNQLYTPIFKVTIPEAVVNKLVTLGYKRARGLMVVPTIMDRNIICQGVTCPTLYTENHRNIDKDLYAQSSWFFRPYCSNDEKEGIIGRTTMFPKSSDMLRYTQRNIEEDEPEDGVDTFVPSYMRQIEISGDYEDGNKFNVFKNLRTVHSPDIEFDDQTKIYDFVDCNIQKAGTVTFDTTMSDIDIQTETPTVSNVGSGFYHKAFVGDGPRGIVAGLFYDDYIVDDKLGEDKHLGAYPKQKASAKWLIYPWQGTGSLNNDINRPSDKGIASAKLKKKIISNLRFAHTSLYAYSERWGVKDDAWVPQVFSGEEDSILKINGNIYKGNIDTTIVPDNADGVYLAMNGVTASGSHEVNGHYETDGLQFKDEETPFDSTHWLKTWSMNPDEAKQNGLRLWINNNWAWMGEDIGDDFIDLDMKKLPVRMKYKSTPHLVIYNNRFSEDTTGTLYIAELMHPTYSETRYGGTSADALKDNIWIPCGEPSNLTSDQKTVVRFKYGDTYYQRYDCLKTYPYTREDLNQIVEIGSFMLESYVNIEGRYDRNRGQSNNLNMSPQNFNLMNQVYSQTDNFFSYRIQDDSYYKNNKYPNQITWSKTKSNSADTDLWTNVTLASVLELDGDKGGISKLIRLNDQLLCFQHTGISQILYNENVQIASTTGVPIEIANSDKVQGKRYLSDSIGCSNKWSICSTPAGIYFMDSNNKSIYRLGEGLQNISQQGGFNSWCKKNIPTSNIKWTPSDFNSFRSYYDKLNQDVLFVNKDTALAFSEKLGVFTSFYDYGDIPYFCSLDDTGIWIKSDGQLWKHQAGVYCNFFGEYKPYGITLVGNPEPQTSKIFTNLEFRACVSEDGNVNTFDSTFDPTFHTSLGFEPFLPFNYLETWNEFQHGYTTLENKNGHAAMIHGTESSALKRKFRIWRCDIPRDNAEVDVSVESMKGITRFKKRPQDRMRNTWLYLELQKTKDVSRKCEIHDFVMTYFN